jgi:hypothetical protein
MIENILYAFIVVLSVSLMTVAFLSFRRSGNIKIGLVMAAFTLFLAKGILFSVQLFTDSLSQESLWIGSGLLDIGILSTIFLATLKR